MTYSFVHNAINTEAFPNTSPLYNPDIMRVRGRGMYAYKNEIRAEGEEFLKTELQKYFPGNKILYFS